MQHPSRVEYFLEIIINIIYLVIFLCSSISFSMFFTMAKTSSSNKLEGSETVLILNSISLRIFTFLPYKNAFQVNKNKFTKPSPLNEVE
ncbi:hypothetical protein FE245_11335 [Aliarcobacter cibarius]|uniref:Uncharacterized protein n=1 Tax=Aliarcobacter cibarius TaxID=255507 RepID=A0ABY2V1S1_9BACT|nr:hypothetical protein FE247_11310 [Aliarcobacter cibarius]TLS95646.1 hypothetical protein FE245_11335 [Aliarcobacter cibarius]